jgi:hypothetical protein
METQVSLIIYPSPPLTQPQSSPPSSSLTINSSLNTSFTSNVSNIFQCDGNVTMSDCYENEGKIETVISYDRPEKSKL